MMRLGNAPPTGEGPLLISIVARGGRGGVMLASGWVVLAAW
jgi:hypothetical protein